MIKYYGLFLLYFFYQLTTSFGQSLTYVFSENLSVCQSIELKILVKNTTNSIIAKPELRLNMPCGAEYRIGSIQGAMEKLTTNPSIPLFQMSNILPEQEIIINMSVFMTCMAIPCLDSEQIFIFNATLFNESFTKDYASPPINADSPNLVITGINNTYEEIPSFSNKNRKINIRNSRAGRAKEFTLRHTYDPHIDVTPNKGRLIKKTSTYIEVQFDSIEFKKIGNGDAWFDFNEFIELNENVFVKVCSYDFRYVRSDYILSWGCNNSICQQNSAIANIRILDNNDLGDKFSLIVKGNEPLCYENGESEQLIIITKYPHKNSLKEIQFKIEQPYLNRGIKVGSLVSDFVGDIKYFDLFTDSCGERLAKYAIVYVANFDPTNKIETLQIKWQTGFCEESKCDTKQNAWRCLYQYRKECAGTGDAFYSQAVTYKDIKLPIFSGTITFANANNSLFLPVILTDKFSGFLIFSFTNEHFTSNGNDTFNIRIEIPKGIEIQNMDFIMDGKFPLKIAQVLGSRDNIYELTYLLPFNSKTLVLKIPFIFDCQKVIPSDECDNNYASCICGESVMDLVNGSGQLILDEVCPNGKHPIICMGNGYEIDCENIKPCYIDTLDGSFGYSTSVMRTNFGKLDADNSGIADDNLTPNPSIYRLNHFVAGDSFDISFLGAIVVDKPGSVFSDLTLRIGYNLFSSNDSTTLNDYKTLLIGNESAIRTYNTKVRIKQKITGKVYEMNKLNELFLNNTHYCHLSADSLRWYNPDTNLPSDFRYSVGDSIYVILSKLIDINQFNKNKNKIKLGQVFKFNYVFQSFVGNNSDTNFDRSPCDCDSPYILFPDFQLSKPLGILNNIFINNPKICDPNFEVRNIFDFSFGHRLLMPPPIGTIFPYEIRESLKPVKIVLGKSNDIEFGNLSIVYLGKQFDFQPKDNGQQIIYDFMNEVPPSGGYSISNFLYILRANLAIRPLKCINQISGSSFDFKIYFELNDLGKLYFPDSIVNKVQFLYPKPKISAFIYQKELTAFSNKFAAGFSLSGPDFVETVSNVFIKIVSPSNNISDFRIRDTITKEIYKPQNGYFQVGSLDRNENRHFEILGTSESCGSDIIYLQYGFDCQPYGNPALQPCFIAVDTIRINFPDALVDLIIEPPIDPYIALCDTISQKVTFFNAGLGNAYDMKIQLRLPQGVKMVSGSAYIYFPARQTTTGFAIKDPVLNAQQISEWSLKDVWTSHAANGLSGAGFFPNNEFDLTYKAVTDCDFTSGLPIVYNINAKKGCKTISNMVTKNSSALNLGGLTPLQPITIGASIKLLGNCVRDEAEITISFAKPSESNTRFIVNLPPDWLIIDGSISTNLVEPKPTIEGKLYVWMLNVSENTVNLKFKIKNIGSLFCFSDLINMYISDRTAVNCIATGQPCDVGSVAGIATLPIEVNQSIFKISEAKLVRKNGQLNLYTELTQSTGSWYGPVSGVLFVDDNNNGKLDSGEKKLENISYYDLDVLRKSVSLWTNLSSIVESEYCKLVLWIPASTNCLCNDLSIPLNRQIEIVESDIILCSDEMSTIGVPNQSGTSYQWNQDQGISCTQCPEAVFMVSNLQNSPEFFKKILIATTGNCQIIYNYNVTVNPQPKLLTSAMTVCKGDTITAITTSGAQYSWQGNGIIQGNQQTLIAVPNFSNTYMVTITDAFGCEGRSNLDVKVVPFPSYFVLSDSIFCKDESASLQVEVMNVDFFSWTNSGNRFDNTLSLKPNIKVWENYVFGLEVRNGPCRKEINIPVRFYSIQEGSTNIEICQGGTYNFENEIISKEGKYCKELESKMGCDSIFCINLIVRDLPDISTLPDSLFKDKNTDLIINAPNGFGAYFWTPSTDLTCTDCPSPMTTTKDSITYLLKVWDDLGCETSKKVKILINEVCLSENAIIPNAFSPNDDSVNDFYTLGNVDLCVMNFKVFNRWGNLVYDEINWNNKWNGKSQNGLPLPQGTYFIQLEFIDSNVIRSTMVDLRKQ